MRRAEPRDAGSVAGFGFSSSYTRVILGLYGDTGKENGNFFNGIKRKECRLKSCDGFGIQFVASGLRMISLTCRILGFLQDFGLESQ